jgi:hypothetical protein
MTDNRRLAGELDVTDDQLRRELHMLEAAGLAKFERIGRARVVLDGQLPFVRDWLQRRGLLSRGTLTGN